ncbi:hypothetical protein [Lacunimicrobium album]
MKPYFLIFWLMLPMAGAAFHFGPGEEKLKQDRVSSLLDQAHQLAVTGKRKAAIEMYDLILSLVPADQEEKLLEVRLEKAKLQIEHGATPKAYRDLVDLAPLVVTNSRLSQKVKSDFASTLASTEFYGTWIMRLEGKPKEMWLPFIESARQRFRYVSEEKQGQRNNDELVMSHQNLESSIRLERMSIEELQGLPLPPEVQRAQQKGEGEGEGEGEGSDGMGEGKGKGKVKAKGKGKGEGDSEARGEGAGVGATIQRAGS